MTLSFFQMSQHGHRGPAVIELKLLDPVCTVELHTATPLTSTRASKSLLQENERVLIAHSAPVFERAWHLGGRAADACLIYLVNPVEHG